MKTPTPLREYLSAIGKKGGQSKSEAKSASSKINVSKALAARLEKINKDKEKS